MKSSIENVNPVQRRVRIELPSDLVSKAFQKAWADVQRKAHIQGFRPGKAPIQIIRKLYGKSVAGDVSYALVNEHIFTVLRENKIVPVAEPVIETLPTPSPDQAFEFTALVDVMPEITLKTHKGLAVTVPQFDVNQAEVDREIAALQRRNAKTMSVETGTVAGTGMLASISHTATLNGEPFPGLTAEKIAVALGHNEVLPELETGIVGMSSGETKVVDVTLPTTYNDSELAGKKVSLQIELHDLQKLNIPALDDEFAKDLGLTSKDELVTRVRENMTKNATQQRRQALEKSLLDTLIRENPFEVPPSLVDAITDSMIQNFRLPNEAEMRKALADEKLRETLRPGARRQAQEMLVLAQIAKVEKLDATDEEIEKHLDSMFGGGAVPEIEPDHVHDESCNHDHDHAPKSSDARTQQMRDQMRRRVAEHLTMTKAMDTLVNSAVVTDVAAR